MTGDDDAHASRHAGRIVRIVNSARPTVVFSVDGTRAVARADDSVLVAVLASRGYVRIHEFDGLPRAGFCLMGACQDCWMWTADGRRLRACTTPITAGLALLTRPPGSAADA
jgi:D-hydroxyproline dehydrogenase subunit gamma